MGERPFVAWDSDSKLKKAFRDYGSPLVSIGKDKKITSDENFSADDALTRDIYRRLTGPQKGELDRNNNLKVLVYDKDGDKWMLNLNKNGSNCVFSGEKWREMMRKNNLTRDTGICIWAPRDGWAREPLKFLFTSGGI